MCEVMRIRIPWLLASFFVCAFGAGCGQKDADDQAVSLFGKDIRLLKEGQGVQVNLDGIEIVGRCNEDDKRAIAGCLARVPITNLKVRRMWVCWPENTLAAKVAIDGYLIFLSKGSDSKWRIAGTAKVISD